MDLLYDINTNSENEIMINIIINSELTLHSAEMKLIHDNCHPDKVFISSVPYITLIVVNSKYINSNIIDLCYTFIKNDVEYVVLNTIPFSYVSYIGVINKNISGIYSNIDCEIEFVYDDILKLNRYSVSKTSKGNADKFALIVKMSNIIFHEYDVYTTFKPRTKSNIKVGDMIRNIVLDEDVKVIDINYNHDYIRYEYKGEILIHSIRYFTRSLKPYSNLA